MEFVKRILGAILVRPLVYIYKNGPSVFLLWEGISDENICYELTRVDSNFWASNDETVSACSEIIERKSNAFIITVYLLIVAYCIYMFVSLLIYKHFIVSQMSALLTERVDRINIVMRRDFSQSSDVTRDVSRPHDR